jgi:hypothetical protein
MKKLSLFLLIVISINLSINSQSKYKDFGLNYSGYNLFGIRYRTGTDKTHFRVTLLNISGTNGRQKDNSSDYKSNSQGFGFNIGLEKLGQISDNVNFYFGPELMTSLNHNIQRNLITGSKSNEITYTPGLGCVFGFVYYFSNRINISAEAIPSIWYSISKNTFSEGIIESAYTYKTFGYGFNRETYYNSFANVTLSFRLGIKSTE